MNIRMMIKVITKKLLQMKQNMVQLRIHQVSTELYEVK